MVVRRAAITIDPAGSAAEVALRHASDDAPGIRRIRSGRGFRYAAPDGRAVRDAATLRRIRALAIPPAWTAVWISADPAAHLQATGRDARGRKQYRYHPRWRQLRDEVKYHRLVEFCAALPRLRRAVARDLACRCLCKRKVVATVVALMERAQLRIGNEAYTRQNGSYGATTLRDRHARFPGGALELAYRAKGGIERRVRVGDRRLARIVRRCRDLPGQRLFQYVEDDEVRPIASTDVNDYLREVTGGPFTAKDYRTWAATMGAALLLCAIERPDDPRACQRCVTRVLAAVAARLGHTPAICRASYVHPRLLDDFARGRLDDRRVARWRRLAGAAVERAREVGTDAITVDALRAIEPAVARYLAEATRGRRRRA